MDAQTSSSSTERYLSPGELCDRWNVDARTLRKFDLPWVKLSPTVRRISLTIIVQYEQAQRLRQST